MIGRSALALTMSFMIATSAGAATPAGPTVAIDNFMFGMDLTVEVGTTVTWVNHDDDPHTVAAVDKSFKSPPLDTNQTYSHAFDKPGEYAYFCSLHPQMIGKIIVKPAG